MPHLGGKARLQASIEPVVSVPLLHDVAADGSGAAFVWLEVHAGEMNRQKDVWATRGVQFHA